nr:transposase [Fischerella sp. PCC 9605]
MFITVFHFKAVSGTISFMLLTYCYRIKPSVEQIVIMDSWLELLRRHWNDALGQRLDWLKRTRSPIDRYSIVSEPIGEIPERVDYYTQQAALKETKQLFPEYKNIWAESQQFNLQRLDKAWKRWQFPSHDAQRGGRPRFKKPGELRSFVFPRVNCPKAGAFVENGILKLSRIGAMPIRLHRPLPDGFTLKQATVVKKADGWYVCVSMQDESVPSPLPLDNIKTVVGIDVGLKEFLTTSSGETVPVVKPYRQVQNHLARQQRFLSRKQKGSNGYKKQQNKIARIHQRVGRIRENFHYNTAHNLVNRYDLIAVEDLNLRGLARTRLGKSILDVAWGSFISKLEAVAVKRGVHVVKVNPAGTTVECSSCGAKVPKTLSIRTHECTRCYAVIDRDENAARNILQRALNAVGLIVPAGGGLGDTQPVKPEAWGWNGVQLSLF